MVLYFSRVNLTSWCRVPISFVLGPLRLAPNLMFSKTVCISELRLDIELYLTALFSVSVV
jgi:hypothetical protein